MRRKLGLRMSSVPRIALLPAAAGGVVAGHFFTYLLAAPSTAQRAALLRQTGHSYLPKAIVAAAALGAIAMGVSAARGVAQRHAGSAPLDWRGLALRMFALQAAGLVLLEVTERLIVGAPVGGIGAVLPIGIAAMAAVAAAVAGLLCLTVHAATSLARALANDPVRRPVAPSVPTRRHDDVRPVLDLLSSSISGRGPPAPFTA